MSRSFAIRVSRDVAAAWQAECDRLTAKTGQRWTVSAYLRMAGDRMLGVHLAGDPRAIGAPADRADPAPEDTRRASGERGEWEATWDAIDESRPRFGRLPYSEAQIGEMVNDGRTGRLAMEMSIAAGKDWPNLDDEEKDDWNEQAIERLRAGREDT